MSNAPRRVPGCANGPLGSGMVDSNPLRLGVLLSGGGRTLLNIHDQIEEGRLHAQITCVISSRPDAQGVKRADRLGLAVHVVSHKETPTPEFHARIGRLLRDAHVDLVCLAGFCVLWQIPPDFTGKVLNVHPALLPDFGGQGFYGRKVHEAVLAAGKTISGCTVHFCDNQYDHGPILLQKEVPVLPKDTPDSLADRVFAQECIAYPEAIARFAERSCGSG